MRLSDLKRFLPDMSNPHTLTAGEKTQHLLLELNALVLAFVVEHREMFLDPNRAYFIRSLAENLKDGWTPSGLTASDMEQVPADWLVGMVRAIVNGSGLSGYEERLYQRFSEPPISQEERSPLPMDLSQVSEPERGDRQIRGRRTYPRRRVS